MEKTVKDTKECCKSRDVLWYLVFLGFAVNYMIRINLNIAIVSMIKPRTNNISLTSLCLVQESSAKLLNNFKLNSTEETPFNNATELTWQTTSASPIKNNTVLKQILKENENLRDWNEKQQGYVLGSFFWLNWLTQIPGGILAEKYGTKLVFGLSNLIGVLFCFLIPFFTHKGAEYLIFIRILQGFFSGFAWPAMHNMTAIWIPPNERSKFVTAYLGSSIGAALTYLMCGYIIDRWGWELVFHVCGVLGTLWFIAWWFLVYDSPAEHPRISASESEYIISSLGQSYVKDKAPVPWLKILTNRTVLVDILAQWGGVWGLFTLMTHAPSYFKFIHGWNIRATGLLSGMPHLFRMLWAYVFSQLGDYLLRSNKMTRSNVRKLATAVCCIVQGIFMIGLAYSGCDRNWAIIFLTLAIASHGTVSSGPLAIIVDISPNYASVILGIINTSVAIAGFTTPSVVGYLTYQNQTVEQWQKVFWIASGQLFASGIIFILFAKSELQPWNSPEKLKSTHESELMVLK